MFYPFDGLSVIGKSNLVCGRVKIFIQFVDDALSESRTIEYKTHFRIQTG